MRREVIQPMTPREVQIAAAKMLREQADQIERGETDLRWMNFSNVTDPEPTGEYIMTLCCGPRRSLSEQTLTISYSTTEDLDAPIGEE